MRVAQEKTRELNDKVLMATVEEMKHRFERDMETLRGRIPTKDTIAKDAALDKKYLAERQKSHGICFDFFGLHPLNYIYMFDVGLLDLLVCKC